MVCYHLRKRWCKCTFQYPHIIQRICLIDSKTGKISSSHDMIHIWHLARNVACSWWDIMRLTAHQNGPQTWDFPNMYTLCVCHYKWTFEPQICYGTLHLLGWVSFSPDCKNALRRDRWKKILNLEFLSNFFILQVCSTTKILPF